MKAEEVTAIIVTRGDVDLDPILETLPYSRIIVWNNAERERDAKCYGRYLAAEEAETEYVFWQDDDLIFRNHDALLAAWEPGKLIVNMPSPWYDSYEPSGQMLPGAGSLCPVGLWRRPFSQYVYYWEEDDFFLTYCDFVFGQLVPSVRYDFGYEPFDYADDSHRICRLPEADRKRRLVMDRARLMRNCAGGY